MTPKDFPGKGDDNLSIQIMERAVLSILHRGTSCSQSKHGIDLVVSILGMDQTLRESRWEIVHSDFLQLVRLRDGLMLLLLGSFGSFEAAEGLLYIVLLSPRNASCFLYRPELYELYRL